MATMKEESDWSTSDGFITSKEAKDANAFDIPLKVADETSFQEFGTIVRDFDEEEVCIEPWPVTGKRPLCPGTGIQAGLRRSEFTMRWVGPLLTARELLAGSAKELPGFVTGRLPSDGSRDERTHVLIREADYHPDGGQVFFPKTRDPFVALVARGDDVRLSDFVAFYFEGELGFQVKTGTWHQAPYILGDEMVFRNKQSATFAIVFANFVKEFGKFIRLPLQPSFAT